jgi:hypothetical protein
MNVIEKNREHDWPSLPYEEWKDTCATLHMWTQIVGKIRLVQTPLINHWWNVTLYLTSSGLTTGPIPYSARSFEIDFDFLSHNLSVRTCDGEIRNMALRPQSVADFYHELMANLRSLGFDIEIYTMPMEVPNPIRFTEDHVHASYDAEYVHRFWHVLQSVNRVFTEFRARFIGKCSPVHFFWGSFDLAVTRFSGRRAPEREGADRITREAYSHEVISHGFWPGGPGADAIFYSYTAPEPPGLKTTAIRPEAAGYNTDLGEFVFGYESVRTSEEPDNALMEFLQSTYEAGANLATWNRAELERQQE